MKKIIIVFSIAVFFAVSALSTPVYAQERASEVKLKIVNSKTKEAVSTASVVLKGKDSDLSRFCFSDDDGVATFSDLPYGDYVLSVRMVSYDEIVRDITVAENSSDIGTIGMNPNSTMLAEYVVEAVAMRTSLKGDTIVYNADAFKVTRDAVLQRLLSKLPGIEVGTDGSITAFGQEVKKILVDGKEFFVKDVKTTVENLPAEMVDKVEVYDELSDHAKLTGTDDGEGYKAINLVTKKDKRNGMFGKVTAQYGIDDLYNVDANITVYNERRRFSLFASGRNDIFNTISYGDDADLAFGTGSLSMSGNFFGIGYMDFSQSGRNSRYSLDGSYKDVFGKRERLNIYLNYGYAHNKSKGANNRESWLFTDQANTLYQNSYTDNRTNGNMYYGSIYMTYEGDKTTFESYTSVNYYGSNSTANLSLNQEHIATNGALSPIQQQRSNTNSNKDNFSFNYQFDWGYKFDKEGRALGVSVSGSYDCDDNYENPRQYFYFPPYVSPATADSLFMRRNYLDGKEYNATASVTYSEPINERNSLSVRYRFDYSYSDHDSRVYLWDYQAAIYNPDYDADLSNIYNSGRMNNRAGIGYNHKGNKVTLDVSILFRNSRLLNKQTTPLSLRRTYSFNNIEYSSYLRWAISSSNSLTARFNSGGSNPQIEQLLEVPDLTSTQIVMVGNPDLKSAYYYRLNLEYRRTNAEKGTTFYVYMNGSMNFNSIVSSTTMGSGIVIPNSGGLTLGEGGRLIEFVNMKSSPRISGSVNTGYSFPVSLIKSNMTVSGGYSYTRSPTLFNSRKIVMKSSEYSGSVKFDSNISENVDFSVSNYFTYTGSKGGATTTENRYKYINNYLYAKLKWIIWQGITVDGTLRYSFQRDITFNDNRKQLSADIFVGKKLFKDDMGEISVGVVDVFNRTKSYDRIVSPLSIVYTTHYNHIGRYFAVRFTYNFRNYKAAQSPPQDQQYFF